MNEKALPFCLINFRQCIQSSSIQIRRTQLQIHFFETLLLFYQLRTMTEIFSVFWWTIFGKVVGTEIYASSWYEVWLKPIFWYFFLWTVDFKQKSLSLWCKFFLAGLPKLHSSCFEGESEENQVFGKRFLSNCGFLEMISRTVDEIFQAVSQKDRLLPVRSNFFR